MESRIINTKRNIIFSYILMVIQIVFQFVSKSVIVYTLGSQYLGLSSLYSSVLTVLNVAELGFTSSVVYFMYKPLAENDTVRVCALLKYLKKVYKIVGIVIMLLGLCAMIILPYLIKGDSPADINIYILYLLYLSNTAMGYFLYAHKTALLTAIQRLDLTKIASCVVTVVQYVLQFMALMLFKSYYMFVVAMILGTISTNILVAYICKKKFPQYICDGDISELDKKEIMTKVRGLLICNISIVTYSTLDNVVISAFVGLTYVAIYTNYMTIYKTVNQLVVMLRSAMQSSVGNSVASESVEKNLHDVYLWQFLFSMISTWCATCMMCLFQPFIRMWMGENMLMPLLNVVLIVVWFSVDIVQQAHFLYLAGAGIWNDLRYSYIFNTICNLLLNILLGKFFGITGIIIASLVTCIISGTFWQCCIIFEKVFKTSARVYILTQFKYLIISAVVVSINYFITSFIALEGLLGIVVKFFICTCLSVLLLFIFYFRNKYFIDAKMLVKKVFKKHGV